MQMQETEIENKLKTELLVGNVEEFLNEQFKLYL
jgi:hypothetical protein